LFKLFDLSCDDHISVFVVQEKRGPTCFKKSTYRSSTIEFATPGTNSKTSF